MPQEWGTLFRKRWILQTIGLGTQKDPKFSKGSQTLVHKSEGMGTLGQQLGLAARDPCSGIWCLCCSVYTFLVSGQGGCSPVGGLAYVPGIGREEDVAGVYGVRGTWLALVLPLLCPL